MAKKYIDTSMLRIGDVLLSRSKDRASTLIASVTKGKYSHAALYIGDSQVFEAIRSGVGYGSLKPCRIEVIDNKWRTLCDFECYKTISVFRCPQSKRNGLSSDDTKLRPALNKILWTLEGCEYTRAANFQKISSMFDIVPEKARAKVLHLFGSRILKDKQKILEKEFFCSELVITVLETLGMQILKKSDQGPDEISPNDLANSEISNLCEVKNLISGATLGAEEPSPIHLLKAQQDADRLALNKMIRKGNKEISQVNKMIVAHMNSRGWEISAGLSKDI